MLTIISQGRGVTIGYLLQHVIFFTIIKWLIVLVGSVILRLWAGRLRLAKPPCLSVRNYQDIEPSSALCLQNTIIYDILI